MTATGWCTDEELFALVRGKLFSAVVGDILDKLGHRHQFLPSEIRPLRNYGVVVGRAMPVLEADVFDYRQPFGKMFEALDDLRAGEIYLAAGGSRRYAFFGELMSVAASARGASGAILYGFHRDSGGLLQSELPVFSIGAYGQDQGVRGRVIDYREAIEIEGVSIEPGDLMVADNDGVVVVPRRVEAEVVREALAKTSIESDVRQALLSGMSVREAFDRFGAM
jgi:4-hydroxy-4-methyl-2-oxoglutarate aldolase